MAEKTRTTVVIGRRKNFSSDCVQGGELARYLVRTRKVGRDNLHRRGLRIG